MDDVTIKSTGALIDELVTINSKIFWALEKANEAAMVGNKLAVGEHYERAQKLNSKRSKLIAAIDNRLGDPDASVEKTF